MEWPQSNSGLGSAHHCHLFHHLRAVKGQFPSTMAWGEPAPFGRFRRGWWSGTYLGCDHCLPSELIRTKMQSQKMAFTDVSQALRTTVQAEGTLGLWKGLSATLLRDVPFSAVYWPCYEYLKPANYQFTQTFLAGAVAGSIASTVTLPMDVLKTRLQIELGESGVKKKNIDVLREIIAAQGYKGLFSGVVPRLLKVAPACAIMISSYEYCKRLFRGYNLASK